MNAERHDRLLRLARIRGDAAAIAILEADRRFVPQPNPMLQRYWMGLRWSGNIGPLEAVWHA